MIVLVFLLWMMAAILFLTNPKSEETRWASAIALYGGFGGLGVMLGSGPNRSEIILWIDAIATSWGHYMTPYAIWMFGVAFSGVFRTNSHFKRLLRNIVFLIPVFYMYSIDQIYPVFKANYVALACWTVPYVMGTNILMIYSTYRETRPAIKKSKIFTCLVILPVNTFALVTNIVLEALGIKEVWFYNPLVITAQFGIFGYLIIRYGFLDVKIRFERQHRDSTMKAVASGTALLNHTIKNEIAKIDFLVNQLKEQNLNEKANENIELALNSTQHVLKLSARIQSKLDVMNLKESQFWLSKNIESTLALLQPYLTSKIKVVKQYEVDAKVHADPIHIQETLLNIIKNALEAMNNEGHILIKLYKTRRRIYIDITDNGKGIPKDKLDQVLNPFFSTKGTKGNYGLGLTYSYNVMQKHGGDIAIKSKVNQGTTFTLSLPFRRVIESNEQFNIDGRS
ncbi:HAMP domain-containing histidine kinase [Bacillus sp. ISL-8]|nr:HAMP domain-containing histidine kinase [Bacillus sp. ISL-8]